MMFVNKAYGSCASKDCPGRTCSVWHCQLAIAGASISQVLRHRVPDRCQLALGCADGGFNLVVPRRVELLFRE